MSTPTATPNLKLERALITYLSTLPALADLTFYPGHGDEVMTEENSRCIVSVTPGGGPLAYAGILQSEVEALLLNPIGSLESQAAQYAALASALSMGNLPTLRDFINADPPPVPGIGISDLKAKPPQEGRDKEKSLHGIGLLFDVTYHETEE